MFMVILKQEKQNKHKHALTTNTAKRVCESEQYAPCLLYLPRLTTNIAKRWCISKQFVLCPHIHQG